MFIRAGATAMWRDEVNVFIAAINLFPLQQKRLITLALRSKLRYCCVYEL